MYGQGRCSPSDLQFAQLYDDYPVMEFIQLEGLGVDRGAARRSSYAAPMLRFMAPSQLTREAGSSRPGKQAQAAA